MEIGYTGAHETHIRPMDPALTEYSKLILCVMFDVTRQLMVGRNSLGVLLGNGRFFAPRSGDKHPVRFKTYGYPELLLQLEIEYADGTRQRVVSDGDWKVIVDSPRQSNNEYHSEEYGARKEMPGWDAPRFNAARWGKVDIISSQARCLLGGFRTKFLWTGPPARVCSGGHGGEDAGSLQS